MVLLRPLTFFSNCFAAQEDIYDNTIDDRVDRLNFAIAKFEKKHNFIIELMNQVAKVYDPLCWPCVGPRLVGIIIIIIIIIIYHNKII